MAERRERARGARAGAGAEAGAEAGVGPRDAATAAVARSAGLAPALGALLARWDTYLAASGRAVATRKAYLADLAGFLGFLQGHLGGPPAPEALSRLSIADFRAFMAGERGRGRTGRGLARTAAAIRGFFGWLEEADGISCQAVHGMRTPKAPRSLPRPISAEAARAALEAAGTAHPEAWIAARDEAVLALLWGAGLRVSEALGLAWGDAPLGAELRVRGKGGRARSVPVLPAVAARIEAYRALCPHAPGASGPLFLGARGGRLAGSMVRRTMAEARAALGLPPSATPHALRHAFATQMLSAGGDLRAVQELLGHASLSATQVYTGVDTARLLAAYERSHPRAKR